MPLPLQLQSLSPSFPCCLCCSGWPQSHNSPASAIQVSGSMDPHCIWHFHSLKRGPFTKKGCLMFRVFVLGIWVLCLYAPHASLVPAETRRGNQSLWDKCYRHLWAALWVFRMEFGSSMPSQVRGYILKRLIKLQMSSWIRQGIERTSVKVKEDVSADPFRRT